MEEEGEGKVGKERGRESAVAALCRLVAGSCCYSSSFSPCHCSSTSTPTDLRGWTSRAALSLPFLLLLLAWSPVAAASDRVCYLLVNFLGWTFYWSCSCYRVPSEIVIRAIIFKSRL
ncbi:hypothetical protein HN51_010245 [Arachis hypogaea]